MFSFMSNSEAKKKKVVREGGGGLLSFETVDDRALTPIVHRKMTPSSSRL